MRKLILYSAVTLDHFISRTDGSIDWLEEFPNPENEDYGYAKFYDSIECTVMGHHTFGKIQSFGVEFPYKEKDNYVFTRKERPSNDHVTFVTDDMEPFIRELKTKHAKDIWLIGGGQLNGHLLKANLIDELDLTVLPVILGKGIPLFDGAYDDRDLELLECKSYGNGVVQMRYKILGSE